MSDRMIVEGVRLPSGRALTKNERAWITFLRLSSRDADPAPTLRRVQALRQM